MPRRKELKEGKPPVAEVLSRLGEFCKNPQVILRHSNIKMPAFSCKYCPSGNFRECPDYNPNAPVESRCMRGFQAKDFESVGYCVISMDYFNALKAIKQRG